MVAEPGDVDAQFLGRADHQRPLRHRCLDVVDAEGDQFLRRPGLIRRRLGLALLLVLLNRHQWVPTFCCAPACSDAAANGLASNRALFSYGKSSHAGVV